MSDTAVLPQKKKAKARPRGTGSIFRQRGTMNWTIQFYQNGKRIREKTGTADHQAAQQKLTARLAQIVHGEPVVPARRKPLLISELYEDLKKDYLRKRNRSLRSINHRWTLHLEPFFRNLATTAVDAELINKYRDSRLLEGAAGASVNREVAMIKRMFRLVAGKLPKLPAFPEKLPENKRTGFIGNEEFSVMVANASELWMKTFLEIAFALGWRRSEILGLRVRNVDLRQRILRLDTSKNNHGRECPITTKIYELLRQCVAGKSREDLVLTRSGNRPVRDFRRSWSKICNKIGRPDLLIHDLRRSAARNLRRAGCSENTIMAIGGWETASVFKRYDIHDNKDKELALAALEARRIADLEADNSHNFSHNSTTDEENRTDMRKELVQ